METESSEAHKTNQEEAGVWRKITDPLTGLDRLILVVLVVLDVILAVLLVLDPSWMLALRLLTSALVTGALWRVAWLTGARAES